MTHRLDRRSFTIALAAAALSPSAGLAQPGRSYRLGSLHQSPRNALHHIAFYEELRRLGFVEGQNLTVDEAGYGMHVEQFEQHAAELVRAQVDVIVCAGDPAVRAIQHATRTLPTLAIVDDIVGSGLTESLAKPEGNITGVSILAAELDRKRQEILLDAVPGIKRMAALADSNVTTPRRLQELQEAARRHGIEFSIHLVKSRDEIAGAIDAAKNGNADALLLLATPLLHNNREIIIPRVAELRLPTIYQWPDSSEEGGLLGYGPRLVQLYREVMVRQLGKLLAGVKPASIPIEQPTKFDLVVNLKTAKAMGLAIPEALLVRADKVIE